MQAYHDTLEGCLMPSGSLVLFHPSSTSPCMVGIVPEAVPFIAVLKTCRCSISKSVCVCVWHSGISCLWILVMPLPSRGITVLTCMCHIRHCLGKRHSLLCEIKGRMPLFQMKMNMLREAFPLFSRRGRECLLSGDACSDASEKQR